MKRVFAVLSGVLLVSAETGGPVATAVKVAHLLRGVVGGVGLGVARGVGTDGAFGDGGGVSAVGDGGGASAAEVVSGVWRGVAGSDGGHPPALSPKAARGVLAAPALSPNTVCSTAFRRRVC